MGDPNPVWGLRPLVTTVVRYTGLSPSPRPSHNEPNPLLDTYPNSSFRYRLHWTLQSHPVSFDRMRLVLLWILPFAVKSWLSPFALTLCRASGEKTLH